MSRVLSKRFVLEKRFLRRSDKLFEICGLALKILVLSKFSIMLSLVGIYAT